MYSFNGLILIITMYENDIDINFVLVQLSLRKFIHIWKWKI